MKFLIKQGYMVLVLGATTVQPLGIFHLIGDTALPKGSAKLSMTQSCCQGATVWGDVAHPQGPHNEHNFSLVDLRGTCNAGTVQSSTPNSANNCAGLFLHEMWWWTSGPANFSGFIKTRDMLEPSSLCAGLNGQLGIWKLTTLSHNMSSIPTTPVTTAPGKSNVQFWLPWALTYTHTDT